MSIFRRTPKPDVLPFFKKHDEKIYYIFVRNAVFGESYRANAQQKELVTILMNRLVSSEEASHLSNIDPELGITTGWFTWCGSSTVEEAEHYLKIFGLRLRLVEEVFRIDAKELALKEELIDRGVMERIHKRHEAEDRRKKRGF